MAIFGGEIVRITDVQVALEQDVLNVYYYRVGTDLLGAEADALAGMWWAQCGLVIRTLQAPQVTHLRILCESLDGSLDYGEYEIPTAEQAGTQTGAIMSPFDTFPFTFRPVNRTVRPGGKRIAGVTEAQIETGGNFNAATITVMNTVANQMEATLSDLITLDTLEPVVVGFPTASRPTRVEVDLNAVQPKTTKSTQNTRKYGVGS